MVISCNKTHPQYFEANSDLPASLLLSHCRLCLNSECCCWCAGWQHPPLHVLFVIYHYCHENWEGLSFQWSPHSWWRWWVWNCTGCKFNWRMTELHVHFGWRVAGHIIHWPFSCIWRWVSVSLHTGIRRRLRYINQGLLGVFPETFRWTWRQRRFIWNHADLLKYFILALQVGLVGVRAGPALLASPRGGKTPHWTCRSF